MVETFSPDSSVG